MNETLLSTLLSSLSGGLTQGQPITESGLTPKQIEQLLASIKIPLENLSSHLQKNQQAGHLPPSFEGEVTSIQKTPPQTITQNQKLTDLLKSFPSTAIKTSSFLDVTFQKGQEFIKVTLPEFIAKEITPHKNYQLIFKTQTPLTLSQINLINARAPVQTLTTTPLDIKSLIQSLPLTPLTKEAPSFIEAFVLPSTSPQANKTASPSSIFKSGESLILNVLKISSPAPETSTTKQPALNTQTPPPSTAQKLHTTQQKLEMLQPFLQAKTPTPTLNAQTNEPTTTTSKSIQNTITIGSHIVNLNANSNKHATVQTAKVISHFEGAPIIELTPDTPIKATKTSTQKPQILILTNTKLDIGAEISLKILQPQKNLETPLPIQQPTIHDAEAGGLNTQWESLDTLIKNLELITPEASTLLKAQIPSPQTQTPKQLSTTLIFFLKALQLNATPEKWMPRLLSQTLNTETVKQPLQLLQNEFEQLTRIVRDTTSGQEFQRFTLPLQTDDKIQPLYVFLRPFQDPYKKDDHHHKSPDDLKISNKKKEIRFLVNLELSHMGAIQIDGLLKNKKNLDMILRVKHSLSSQVKNTLTSRYRVVLESLGLEGSMRIQNEQGWLTFEDIREKTTLNI